MGITRLPVMNLNGMTTPETGWYHLYYVERLVRIDIVDNAAAVPRVIAAGKYRFSFQVMLPEFWMPNVNVWLLSLCRDMQCTDLVATYPAPGFYFEDTPNLLDETANQEAEKESGGASRHVPPALSSAAL